MPGIEILTVVKLPNGAERVSGLGPPRLLDGQAIPRAENRQIQF